MFLYTIYEIIQMNIKVNFKGNRARRHACASSNICRMAYAITEWSLEATTKNQGPLSQQVWHDRDPSLFKCPERRA